jgi:hypothetical protein
MGQDLAGQVFPDRPHLTLEREAVLRCLAERPGAPFQAPAQHRVVVDELPDLLGGACVRDGHQAPPLVTTTASLNNFTC